MKKLIILLIAILLLISGCSSSKHKLIKEDGNYYITYDTPSVHSSSIECEPAYNIPFKSMKEMKDAIINVDFTEEQLYEIAKRYPPHDGKLRIVNIDELYECIYPSDLNCIVEFDGPRYSWTLNDKTGSVSIVMSPTSEENFLDRKDFEKYLNSLGDRVLSVTNTTDRNAAIIEYSSTDGINRYTYYTITTEDKTLVVTEKVIAREGKEDSKLIQIYGKHQERYFYVSAYKYTLDERPSVEWLSQFGIKEYVDP